MKPLREIFHRVLSLAPIRSLFNPLIRGKGVILRLHRFSDPALGIIDRDPEGIRRVLEFLRAEKYDLVPLDEMLRRLAGEGPPIDRTIAVTIDDGYFDQATIGAPLFAEYDCPVTTFVTTGFLDGQLWFWWDKIRYVFGHSPRSEIRIELAEQEVTYKLTGVIDRKSAASDFIERSKRVAHKDKQLALQHLATVAEVEVPDRAPPEYAPMTWEQVRACEKQGMSFGPHTVTHPILARTSPDQSRNEILESWKRLCAEVEDPIDVFCYPNGGPDDFGAREIQTLKAAGFTAAVSTIPGYNSATTFQADEESRYELRRFGNIDSLPHVIRFVSGAERLRHALTAILPLDLASQTNGS